MPDKPILLFATLRDAELSRMMRKMPQLKIVEVCCWWADDKYPNKYILHGKFNFYGAKNTVSPYIPDPYVFFRAIRG